MYFKIKPLSDTPLSEITRCFNEAFSDYFVKINATESYLRTRWQVARVDYGLSFGAFDGGKMVGFVIHGIGKREGMRTAHNVATGIEPPHRGQGLLGKIYEVAIQALRANGIEQTTLEVISKNKKAIRAYEKVGFRLRPELLHCFQGVVSRGPAPPNGVSIRIVEKPNWERYASMPSYPLTWEMTPDALSVFPEEFEYRELWNGNEFGGYVIHAPKTGLIQQLNIRPDFRRRGFGQLLLSDLVQHSPNLRMNNVPASATAMLHFLKKTGMKNNIDQYEMEMGL